MTGLNIRHVGRRNAQVLAEHFGPLDEIMEQSEESLAEVEDIGPVIAQSVHSFFSSAVGKELVEGAAGAWAQFRRTVDRSTRPKKDGPTDGQNAGRHRHAGPLHAGRNQRISLRSTAARRPAASRKRPIISSPGKTRGPSSKRRRSLRSR